MKHLRYLHYFQTNKLALHNIMDAGRMQEILVSETKHSLLLMEIAIVRVPLFSYSGFLSCRFRRMTWWSCNHQVNTAHGVDCVTGEGTWVFCTGLQANMLLTVELGKLSLLYCSNYITLDSKRIYPLLFQTEALTIFYCYL